MARPNSAGSPYRRSGMFWDRRARTSSGSPARASSSRTRSVAILTGKTPLTRDACLPVLVGEGLHHPGQAGEQPVGDSQIWKRRADRGGQHEDDGPAGPGQRTRPGALPVFAVEAVGEHPGQPDGAEEDALERGPPRVVSRARDGPKRGSPHADQGAVQAAEAVPGGGDQLAGGGGIGVVGHRPGGAAHRAVLGVEGRGGLREPLYGCGGCGLMRGAHQDVGPVRDEGQRRREPQPPAAPGHEVSPVPQSKIHAGHSAVGGSQALQTLASSPTPTPGRVSSLRLQCRQRYLWRSDAHHPAQVPLSCIKSRGLAETSRNRSSRSRRADDAAWRVPRGG